MQLQLTDPERELMIQILSHRYRDLLHEVSKTSRRSFKHMLIEDERMLEIVLSKLGAREPLSN